MPVAPVSDVTNKQISVVTKFSPNEIIHLIPPPDNLDLDYDKDQTSIKVDAFVRVILLLKTVIDLRSK